MEAFHATVVAAEQNSGDRREIRLILKWLQSGTPAERILAAQTLGFVGDKASEDLLAGAAEHDQDAAVRLYAIDSLGMLGGKQHWDLFRRLEKT